MTFLNTVNVAFRLTMRDLLPAFVAMWFKKFGWAVVALGVIMVVAAFYPFDAASLAPPALLQNFRPLFVMIPTAPLMVMVGCYLTARAYFKNNPNAGGEHQYSFSDEGVGFTGLHSQGTIRWTGLTQAWETRRFFLLYVDKSRAIVIPKRFFAAESDAQTFRALLRRQLPKSQLWKS
jgi:hypothetical protein